jgi:glycerate 2-kinase
MTPGKRDAGQLGKGSANESGAAWLSPRRRRLIRSVQEAALAAVEPGQALHRHLRRDGDRLLVGAHSYDLDRFQHVWIAGGGKAAEPMVRALAEILDDRLSGGIVITKYGHASMDGSDSPVELCEAGHPIPDAAGVAGTRRLAEMLDDAGPDDLILCPISGGGSALLVLPAPGVELSDLQTLTEQLLRSGATINELNAVRKHLSQIKGGGLARLAAPATVVSLILSDVVGDPLDVIASGPTAPDTTTYQDAWRVLERYRLIDVVPEPVRVRLQAGLAGQVDETPKPDDPLFERVTNVLVGSNRLAAQRAAQEAQRLGFNTLLLSTFVEGEAREVALVAAALAKEILRYDQPLPRPACLIWGGETTVTVRGDGRGGRNQELALAAALALEGRRNVALLALATDGTDGPTDAAGALVGGETAARARAQGLEPADFLARNDSYAFFAALGDLVVTGPTQTNVNDLLCLFAFASGDA